MQEYWDNYVGVLKKYAVFTGRATRKEFWRFCLVHLIVTALLWVLFTQHTIAHLYGLAVFLPITGLSIRRLRDMGQSPWWLLVALIPVAGTIVLIAMFLQPSKRH